ncbi:MAG TPA: hypothetical protein VJ183_00615 [Chloroflexia bacterium]|nr:hypothetical protein [Chloroflexia bacterium]
MSKRLLSLVTGAVVALLAATSYGPAVSSSAAHTAFQSDCQTFKETGKSVCGKFLNYWTTHGGLAQQGYPISNEFKEVSETDGKTYTVQYFERAVFEAHPENKAPYDVLLSLLGTMFYKQKYPNGAPELPPDMRPEPGMVFPETGKTLRGIFLEYWKSHGGLMQQGYPLTNLVSEKSDLDGKTYTVQYFERAVFELHPENKPPFDVLLSQLGRLQYARKYPNGAPAGPAASTVAQGQWGGKGIGLWIDGKSIRLDYDCANGTVNGTSIPLNSDRSFKVEGFYTLEHGGSDQVETPHTALYTGTVNGNTMTLMVHVSNASPTNPSATGEQVYGPFTLIHDAQPDIKKCL